MCNCFGQISCHLLAENDYIFSLFVTPGTGVTWSQMPTQAFSICTLPSAITIFDTKKKFALNVNGLKDARRLVGVFVKYEYLNALKRKSKQCQFLRQLLAILEPKFSKYSRALLRKSIG